MLPNYKQQYPIHIAAQNKHFQPETMKLFTNFSPNCLGLPDIDGMTSLQYACQRSESKESVEFILSHFKDNINNSNKVS